jgi:RimJ/RimL family protein N-acetyltransferase
MTRAFRGARFACVVPGARVDRDERVALRTIESEDAAFLQRANANPELRYPLGSRIRSRAEIDVAEMADEADHFLVCLDDEGAAPGAPDDDAVTRIGAVSVHDADWKRPELGYWLVPEVHGEGYGSEAVALTVEYAFRTYDTPAIGAQAFAFNHASRGLLESLGFALEGRLTEYMFVDGAHRDMLQYGLSRAGWRDRVDGTDADEHDTPDAGERADDPNDHAD